MDNLDDENWEWQDVSGEPSFTPEQEAQMDIHVMGKCSKNVDTCFVCKDEENYRAWCEAYANDAPEERNKND